jgi:uncharacterized protein HemY
MRILAILICIAVLVLIAALVYADFKWRRWMAQRRQERVGAAQQQNGSERV